MVGCLSLLLSRMSWFGHFVVEFKLEVLVMWEYDFEVIFKWVRWEVDGSQPLCILSISRVSYLM